MRYTLASLFSGAGFLDLAFSENGFDVLWGCEVVREFAQTNNHNMRLRYGHNDVIKNDDVTTVDTLSIPKPIGVIGGPPCQDFSVGNARSVGISGQRGSLIWDYLHKIAQLEPDFFLFENVQALFRTEKHRTEALLPLVDNLKSLGYRVEFKILNSLEFGIPQDRSRLFIVGFRSDLIDAITAAGHAGFSWPIPYHENPKKLFSWPTTWEFGTNVDEEQIVSQLTYPYDLTIHSVISDQSQLQRLPNHVTFRCYSDKFSYINEGDVRRKSFKRLHRFRYSPTVAYGHNEVHLHPTEPRRLTVREALRIQSVPDWYEFPDGISKYKMFKMVGNGVPYRLAEQLAERIKQVLDVYYGMRSTTTKPDFQGLGGAQS